MGGVKNHLLHWVENPSTVIVVQTTKYSTYKKESFMAIYNIFTIHSSSIELIDKDDAQSRFHFSLPEGYNFDSLSKELYSCYKYKYERKIPRGKKTDYTYRSYADFSSTLGYALKIHPHQVSQAIDAYNECSVPMQVEIIFSIIDMVNRIDSSFVSAQDDNKAQEVIDALDAL